MCSAVAKLPLLQRASWLAGGGCPFAKRTPLPVKVVAAVVLPPRPHYKGTKKRAILDGLC